MLTPISVLCWSLSFYPQPILNYRRRSTEGLAVDFSLLNLLGFTSYATSCLAFLYSTTIRSQYAYRYPTSPMPTVRVNDLAFALHAVVMCVVTYSQFFPSIWGFTASSRQRSSKAVLGIFWGCIFGVAAVLWRVSIVEEQGGMDASAWAWIDVVGGIDHPSMDECRA